MRNQKGILKNPEKKKNNIMLSFLKTSTKMMLVVNRGENLKEKSLQF
jgi:hypothetical protein